MSEALHAEIRALKERNARVEADKAWEVSRVRMFLVAALTYGVILILMWMIGVERPYLDALVPTTGFIFSTLSLQFVKRFWVQHVYRRDS